MNIFFFFFFFSFFFYGNWYGLISENPAVMNIVYIIQNDWSTRTNVFAKKQLSLSARPTCATST